MFSNNKGVTLAFLMITIIVLLILTGAITYSGISALKDAKIQTFTNTISEIQHAIDTRWLKHQNDSSISLLGTKVTSSSLLPETLPTDPEVAYYLLDSTDIANLGLSDLEANRYIVNYSTGEVIDTIGIEVDGTIYHTIELLDI